MCGHRCATTTAHWTPLPHHHHRRRQNVKDAAQGAAEDAAEDVAQDLAFGARAARPPRHATAAAAAVFVQLARRWGHSWVGSVAFGSGCGQTPPGVPRKGAPGLHSKGRSNGQGCCENGRVKGGLTWS